jgi:hypothetical protein
MRRRLLLSLPILLAGAFTLPVLAHHGWSWTESGFFQLEGVVADVYVGNPHATIDIDVEGTVWRVELAPPNATVNAGFTEDAVAIGDEIIAIGNRSVDENETRMKAVRVIVGDATYDVYPDRASDI